MNAAETECLSQDDIRLFHKGACHIFAVTLKASFSDEGYTLKRVVLEKDSDTKEAYHVFASRPGFIVDACGIKREDDYLAWLTGRHREKSFGSLVTPVVTMRDTSEAELLAHHREDTDRGSVNRWCLFSGQDFVAVARGRATALIQHWPEKYRVSVLSKVGL
jgi:hypothetical protein